MGNNSINNNNNFAEAVDNKNELEVKVDFDQLFLFST